MMNSLQLILLQKQREVVALKALIHAQPEHVIAKLLRGQIRRVSLKNFKNVLRSNVLTVIAEIKRKSPSKGTLATIKDPTLLAKAYIDGGASALSVLTDELFFGGTLHDLKSVADSVSDKSHPVLRKDFIIDPIQIAEAIVAGADAILCMVSALGQQTKVIIDAAKMMGIDVLVEVHDYAELEVALQCGAEIMGVNNRDLSTFQIDTERALQLVEHIPTHIIKVAESGILQPELARRYYCAGFDAVLIGEALVTTTNPKKFIRACCHASSIN